MKQFRKYAVAALASILTFLVGCAALALFMAFTGFEFHRLGALLGTAVMWGYVAGMFWCAGQVWIRFTRNNDPHDYIAVIAEEIRDYRNERTGLHHISSEVKAEIKKEWEVVVEKLESGKLTPRDVVNQIAGDVAGDLLETGRYHIQRGILGPTGLSLQTLYRESWRERASRGLCRKDEADEEIDALTSSVSQIG